MDECDDVAYCKGMCLRHYKQDYRTRNLERIREWDRRNGPRYRGKNKEYQRKYREEHKEQRKLHDLKYRENNREKIRRSIRKHKDKVRDQVYDILGHECARCGFKDKRALQIDHVDGKGYKERWLGPLGICHKVIDSGGQDYQILCANCNWIKRGENREHL